MMNARSLQRTFLQEAVGIQQAREDMLLAYSSPDVAKVATDHPGGKRETWETSCIVGTCLTR